MKLAPGAWRYALPPLLAAPFALLLSVGAALVTAALGGAVLAFFRDPERTPPPRGVVSPADGTVSVLREETDPSWADSRVRLGVFMNVWNVHVARAPFGGRIVDTEHVPGAHRPAFSKDSDRNERLHVRFASDGADVDSAESDADSGRSDANTADQEPTVTFVAGAFARRIHPYVDPGDDVERGQRLGHIAFGSRIDVLFPSDVDLEDLRVEPGDRVTAGETVVLDDAAGLGGEPAWT